MTTLLAILLGVAVFALLLRKLWIFAWWEEEQQDQVQQTAELEAFEARYRAQFNDGESRKATGSPLNRVHRGNSR